MDAKTKRELESIKIELQNIIKELNDIASGVNSDFKGIGNEHCANCVKKVSDKFQRIKGQLNNID